MPFVLLPAVKPKDATAKEKTVGTAYCQIVLQLPKCSMFTLFFKMDGFWEETMLYVCF